MQWMNASEDALLRLGSPEAGREQPLRIDRVQRGDAVVHRDPRWYYRWGAVPLMAAMALFFVPNLFTTTTDRAADVAVRVIGVVMIVFCLFAAWWIWRVGSIRLAPRGVREYGCYRPHSWAWEELDRASVEVLIPPMKVIKCRTLILHLKNGKSHLAWCTLANPKDGEASWVDAVAREINEQIAARQ